MGTISSPSVCTDRVAITLQVNTIVEYSFPLIDQSLYNYIVECKLPENTNCYKIKPRCSIILVLTVVCKRVATLTTAK